MVYSVACDQWMTTDNPILKVIQDSAPTGRINHQLTTRGGSVSSLADVILTGGYSGTALNDVWVLSLQNNSCAKINDATACGTNPFCVFCGGMCTNLVYGLTPLQSCQQANLPADLVFNCLGTPLTCGSYEDCESCASDPYCAWSYIQTGPYAGINGACANKTNSPVYSITNATLCNYCGLESNCLSCAGISDPVHPGVGGQSGICGWFENHNMFANSFCIAHASALFNMSSTRYIIYFIYIINKLMPSGRPLPHALAFALQRHPATLAMPIVRVFGAIH